MSDGWKEVGSSLIGVALAIGFVFWTPTGRRLAARVRERRSPGTSAVRVALVMAAGTLVGVSLAQRLIRDALPRSYEIASAIILAVGMGALSYAIDAGVFGDE